MDLYKQVKLESSKYVDINSVLSKLNDKGYIQQLGSLLEKIFHEEQAYTIQELSRLMKNLSKDKYFDMDMQFKMNTSIFKANFEVILGILYNNIWNKVTQEFSNGNNNNTQEDKAQGQQQVENQDQILNLNQNQNENENQQQQQQESNTYNNGAQQQQYNQYSTLQQQLQQNQQIQKQQEQQNQNQQQQQIQNNNNKSQLQNQSNSQYNGLQVNNNNVSGVLNISGDGWVRKQLKNNAEKNNYNNNLSITNNNSQLLNKSDLYEGKRGQIAKNSSNINLSVLSNRKRNSNNLLQNNSKVSISSVRSNTSVSKIGGQVPFSETGSQFVNKTQSPDGGLNSSFSRAPRDMQRNSFEQSPGPSHYNPNDSIHKVRQASPNTKFGKSARISWIDEKLRYDSSVQSPGAKYDYNKKSLSKPLKSTNQKI